MKAFCPFCEKEYDNLEVQTRYEITTLNGVTAEWQKKYITCPDCGEELYNGKLHDANLRVVYAACKVSDIDKPVEDLCDYVLKLRTENAALRERLKETAHRAEVAEKALKLVSECDKLSDAFCEARGGENCDFRCNTCLYNYFLQQAERELAEEGKDD